MKTLAGALAISIILLVGCGAGSRASGAAREQPTLQERYSTFADAVRAQPRLRVSGDQVFLRTSGASSITGSNEVVFALDRQILGPFSRARSTIDLADVASMRVLTAREGGERYGLLGSNGVVEIVPKRS